MINYIHCKCELHGIFSGEIIGKIPLTVSPILNTIPQELLQWQLWDYYNLCSSHDANILLFYIVVIIFNFDTISNGRYSIKNKLNSFTECKFCEIQNDRTVETGLNIWL